MIFINYRRENTQVAANVIYYILNKAFPGKVFQDINSIEGGDIWNDEIEENIQNAEVFIALIPENWLYHPGNKNNIRSLQQLKGESRLHKEYCFVRKEIALAIKYNKKIVPVLLDGAESFGAESLPDDLQKLCEFNFQRLNMEKPINESQLNEFVKNISKKIGVEISNNNSNETEGVYTFPLREKFPLPSSYENYEHKSPCPYVGLRPFKEKDAQLFFGRSKEVFTICHQILDRKTNRRLILIDGYSGTGKSSFLQAGVIPRIKAQEWNVFYVRREEDRIRGLNYWLKDKYESLKRDESNLIILDQVEEVLNNPIESNLSELTELINEIIVLLESSVDLKLVLSFRSEYKSKIKKELHDKGLSNQCMDTTLYPLDRNGVVEAIKSITVLPKNPAGIYPITFINREEVVNTIAEKILKSRENYQVAPLLQVNMELIWKNSCQDNRVVISLEDIQGFIEDNSKLLSKYINEVKERINGGAAEELLILEFLNFFIEKEPVSAIRLEEELINHDRYGNEKNFQAIRKELEKQYLISVTIQNQNERVIRLSHDILAKEILDRYLALNRRSREDYQRLSFDVLIKKLPDLIYEVNFNESYSILKELIDTGIRANELEKFFIEILFFWNECSNEKMVGQTINITIQSNILDGDGKEEIKELKRNYSRDLVREWISEKYTKTYKRLNEKYLCTKEELSRYKGATRNIFGREHEIVNKWKIDEYNYELAKTQVTFWQYGLYCYANGREDNLEEVTPIWGIKGDHPVVNVSWYDCIEYCNWLSRVIGYKEVYYIDKRLKDTNNLNVFDDKKWLIEIDKSADGFRLPTEFEWELSAYIGVDREDDSTDNELEAIAWFDENSGSSTQPVGQKIANKDGVHDLLGNVFEWCQNWGEDDNDQVADIFLPVKGELKILKGGSWSASSKFCLLNERIEDDPFRRLDDFGFRLLRQGV